MNKTKQIDFSKQIPMWLEYARHFYLQFDWTLLDLNLNHPKNKTRMYTLNARLENDLHFDKSDIDRRLQQSLNQEDLRLKYVDHRVYSYSDSFSAYIDRNQEPPNQQ